MNVSTSILTTIALLLALGSTSQVLATTDNPVVRVTTSQGVFDMELYADKAPDTVANFLAYVDSGHYTQTLFHRVIADFMVQGGGFTPSYTKKPTRPPIHNEAYNGLKNKFGSVAMARTGDPHSATAQFFINVNNNSFLDFKMAPYGPANTISRSQLAVQDGRSGRLTSKDCRGRRIDRSTLQKAKGNNKNYVCLMQAILDDKTYSIDRELASCLPQLKQLRQSGKLDADKTCSDYVNERHLALKLVHVNWGYAVFARVIEGMDVVQKIEKLKTGSAGPFRKDAPQPAVIIESIQRIKPQQEKIP